MELQVQENFVASGLDLPDNLRTFCIEKLHADFHKGLLLRELVQEGENLLPAGKIASYNYIFTHYFTPPIISQRFSIP